MDKLLSKQQLIDVFSSLFRKEPELVQGGFAWAVLDVEISVSDAELETAFQNAKYFSRTQESEIYSDTSYEVLLKAVNRRSPSRFVQGIQKTDSVNNFRYDLSVPTKEFFIHHVSGLAEIEQIASFYRVPVFLLENIEETGHRWPHELSRTFSLKIESDKKQSLKTFRDLSSAFLFEFGYNTGTSFISHRHLPVYSNSKAAAFSRRRKPEEIEPPRRIYNEELVHYYLMAISSASPSLEYLSYYQVAEFFFAGIFEAKLIEEVKMLITGPGFSFHRKTDLRELVNKVARSVKLREEELTFDERIALELTLSKYVSVDDLRARLQEFDVNLIEYYAKNKVPFSSGERIDFSDSDEKVLNTLSKRVYATRNSIVHSKDGNKARYTPFKDDEALAREIPLVRFMAETIIVSSSQIFEA